MFKKIILYLLSPLLKHLSHKHLKTNELFCNYKNHINKNLIDNSEQIKNLTQKIEKLTKENETINKLAKEKEIEFNNYKDTVSPILYPPVANRIFINKIIFIDIIFRNLNDLHKLIPNSDYIFINTDILPIDTLKKILNYRIVVVNAEASFLNLLSKNQQYAVSISHGLGFFKKFAKYSSYVDNKLKNNYNTNIDYLIVPSEKCRKIYADSLNIPKSKTIALGVPQAEKLLNTKEIKRQNKIFLKDYPSLKNKKIYGFYPTFNDYEARTVWNIDFDRLASLLNKDEIILYKLHPICITNGMRTNFKEIKNKIMNFSHIDNLNVRCPFNAIVTDYSSSIFEFLLLNKKMVFFKNELPTGMRETYIKYEDLPGKIIYDNEPNKEEKIINALRTKYTDKKKYLEFKNDHCGACTKNTKKQICDFLINLLSKFNF